MNNKSDPALQSKLEAFFLTALQEIYWSEQHLVTVLQTMTEAATDTGLKDAFSEHREQTLTHVKRLEEAFQAFGQEPMAKSSKGMQGIFDEGWRVIDETEEGSSQRDVALIIAAQKVEHYEMACYGSIINLAKTLGKDDISESLTATLEEEKQTDLKLTSIAESGINEEASQESIDSSTEDVTAQDSLSPESSDDADRDPAATRELVM